MNTRHFLLLLVSAALAQPLFGQSSGEGVMNTERQPPIFWDTIGDNQPYLKEAEDEPKKKEFYGIKTRKAYTKEQRYGRTVVELFYTIKERRWFAKDQLVERPNPYVRHWYWYDRRYEEIRRGHWDKEDREHIRVLHGPYYKIYNGDTIAHGIFYKGLKHGRWEKWKANDNHTLKQKRKYYKGYPKNAQISYYDGVKHQKPKEIIPYQNGHKNGYYYKFYENGNVKVEGQYQMGVKVEDWHHYYENGQLHQEIHYADEYEDSFGYKPYIYKEYNEEGDRIYYEREERGKPDYEKRYVDDPEASEGPAYSKRFKKKMEEKYD